jgi:hypothetical protein
MVNLRFCFFFLPIQIRRAEREDWEGASLQLQLRALFLHRAGGGLIGPYFLNTHIFKKIVKGQERNRVAVSHCC